MAAPSLNVTIGDRGESQPDPGDVGAWLVAGLFDRGPTDRYVECRSLSTLKAAFGDVVSYSYMVRAAEAYFREANGAGRMLVKRTVGPAATKGTLALSSAVPAVVGTFTAISEGAWPTEITFTVATGSGSTRTVTMKQNGTALFSEAFTAALDLQAAIEATGLGTFPLGAGSWPLAVLAETAVSAGSDDRASIPTTQAGWVTELAIFDEDAGTGTVSLPGVTTPAAHAALLEHAETFRRFAELDAIDTATVASLTAPAATLRALDERAGYGQLLAPWVQVPGPGSGTVTIPPSGAVAGRMAAADRENPEGPGQPAACGFGVFRWVQDVTQEWTRAERDTLSDAGVTVIRNVKGKVQPFDSRTLADPNVWPQYDSAAGMRVVLAIASQAQAVLNAYLEKVITPGLYSTIKKDIVAIGMEWWSPPRNAIFGATPEEAFEATVGAGTAPRSVAANLSIRPSESVNRIDFVLTTVATEDTI
jgi:hypothetical protein